MCIRSIFTSNEKLFAEWMMHLEFNKKIQAEPRFPGVNQDFVRHNYFTIPKSSPIRSPSDAGKMLIRKIRVKNFSTDEKELIKTICLDDSSNAQKELMLRGLLANCLREQARLQGKQISDEEVVEKLDVLFNDFSREEKEVIFEQLLACFSIEGTRYSKEASLIGCTKEEFKIMKEKVIKRLEAGLRGEPISESLGDVPKQQPIYQIVHGPVVQKVEKKSAVENVKYGDFWGQTRFTVTKKRTGYFLVEGWLVVSVPEKIKDRPFEINKEDEITVVHKLDESFGSVASSKINGYIQEWFSCEIEKLSIVSAASFSGATLFSALVPTLAKSDNLAGQLLALALVTSCVAMAAMVIYSGVKLYNLYCLKEKMDYIQNLGDWVSQIRYSALEYPDLSNKAHSIQNFFTPQEQKAIPAIDEYNRMGYIRRLFNKNPVVVSQVKV